MARLLLYPPSQRFKVLFTIIAATAVYEVFQGAERERREREYHEARMRALQQGTMDPIDNNGGNAGIDIGKGYRW